MTNQMTATDRAREAARKPAGRFGNQDHAEAGIVTIKRVRAEKPLRPMPEGWYPDYNQSHYPGAFAIHNVEYLDGGKGFVHNNYPDGKWRIGRQVTDMGEAAPTFATRGKAATAEYKYATSPTVVRAALVKWKESLVGRKATPGMDPKAIAWCEDTIAKGEKLLTDAGLPIDES